MLGEMEENLPTDWYDWHPLTRAQYIEINGFMSSYLLSCQGDRVAMAHSVEARYPFLDPELVDFCFTLGKNVKLIGTRDKLALRRVARRHLPSEISDRRKQPFRAPIGSALFGVETERFHSLLSPTRLAEAGHFDVSAVTRLLARTRARGGGVPGEREEMGLVGVLTLQLLSDAYLRQFWHRSQDAQKRLANMQCHVFVDRLNDGDAPLGFIPTTTVEGLLDRHA
jgi:asparagine synthase (glutamine-hydrolysing)